MFDDMISTAGSICGAAELVQKQGAQRDLRGRHPRGAVRPGHSEAVQGPRLQGADHRFDPADRPEQRIDKIESVSVAPLLGEAIKRIHHDESISELFREDRV